MIVYGKNVFTQIQDQPEEIQELYIQDSLKDRKVLDALNRLKHVKVNRVSRAVLDRMSDRGVHQGIVARVRDIPTVSLEQLIDTAKKSEHPLIVALDELQDPHNLGAILRTCDAAGVSGVLMTRHNSATLTPAAIKASTGAAYTVPVCVVSNLSQALDQCKEAGFWIAGTAFEGARDYREGMYDVPVVLVIGNEGKGISRNVLKHCDYRIKLPMKGSVQSLNASVAAAILLYEIQSQRKAL